MQALLFSTGVVALAEIGDKTQLLALLLAARYKKPVPIILGIFVATVVNHLFAAAFGQWLTSLIGPNVMRWLLGLGFLAMAGWLMIPDKLDGDTRLHERLGVFGATLLAFFMAEMGDKTQLATVALAAKYQALTSVVIGTTLGMLLANVPVVLIGEAAAKKLPPKLVHAVAACLFAALGMAVLFGLEWRF